VGNSSKLHLLKDVIFQRAKFLNQTKEAGNVAFKDGMFMKAYDLYTKALAIDPKARSINAKLYFNRATVSAKVVY